jgi:hypothetical protein
LLVLIFLIVLTGLPMAIIPLPIAHYLKSQGILPAWIPVPPIGGPPKQPGTASRGATVSQ